MRISVAANRLLALSMLAGVGPATLRKIAGTPCFLDMSIESLATRFSAVAKAISTPGAWSLALEQADKQVVEAEKYDARVICALDEDYPSLLSSTKDDPFILFVRGKFHELPEKSVAVIGTRQPTQHGAVIVNRITEYFSSQSWSVVSGLAIGCDGLAHRAAIQAGGHTVAVLAHGLQTIAPAQHRKLADEILESGGALISEYPFGQGVLPQQFVKRDRIQAGLAQGVVMVQSDVKGGSLHASRAALDYGRWLAVPIPTSTDRRNEEPKIQANLVLAEGGVAERASLLKCQQNKLSNVIILRTKDDYTQMVLASSIEPSVISSNEVCELAAESLEAPLPTPSELDFKATHVPEGGGGLESQAEVAVDLLDSSAHCPSSAEIVETQVSNVEVDKVEAEKEQVEESGADSSRELTLQHQLF